MIDLCIQAYQITNADSEIATYNLVQRLVPGGSWSVSESGLASPVISGGMSKRENLQQLCNQVYNLRNTPELLGFLDCIFPTNDTTRARKNAHHFMALPWLTMQSLVLEPFL
jgi:hypothetical protein